MVFKPYSIYNDWGDDAVSKQTIIQSVTTLGSALGSMLSGPILEMGRWKALMFANVLVIVSAILSMIMNFPCLIIGRLIFGYVGGAFSVFCPKYVLEASPVEIKGMTGSMFQIGITLGILFCFFAGFVVKVETDTE